MMLPILIPFIGMTARLIYHGVGLVIVMPCEAILKRNFRSSLLVGAFKPCGRINTFNRNRRGNTNLRVTLSVAFCSGDLVNIKPEKAFPIPG